MLAQRKMERRLHSKHYQNDISELLQSIHDLHGEFDAVQEEFSGNLTAFINQFSSLCDKYSLIKERLTLYIPQSEIDAVELEVVKACQVFNDQLSVLDAYAGAQTTIATVIDSEIEQKRARMAKAKHYNKDHKWLHDQIVGGCVMLIPILGIGIPFTILSGLVAGTDILASVLVKHGVRHSIASTQLKKLEAEDELSRISNELSKSEKVNNELLLRRGFFAMALSRYHKPGTMRNESVNVNYSDSAWDKGAHVPLVGTNRKISTRELVKRERRREHELKHATLDLLSAANHNYLTKAVEIVEKYGDNPAILNGDGAFSIDKRCYDGDAPLLVAIHKRHNALARALLTAPGIDVNRQDGYSRAEYNREDRFYYTYNTPLTAALGKRNAEMAEVLLGLPNIDINLTSTAKQTPLICAVRHSEKFIPTILKFDGVNVNAQDCDGRAALHYACFRSWPKRSVEPGILMLLRCGGLNLDPVDRNEGGWTPLMYAAKRGDMPMVKALIEAGANPGFTNRDDMNAKKLAELHVHERIAAYIGENYSVLSDVNAQRPGM